MAAAVDGPRHPLNVGAAVSGLPCRRSSRRMSPAGSCAMVAAIRTPRGLDDLVEGLRLSGYGDIEDILTGVAFGWLALGKVEVETFDVPLHAGILARLKAATAEFWARGRIRPASAARLVARWRYWCSTSSATAGMNPATLTDPETFAEMIDR